MTDFDDTEPDELPTPEEEAQMGLLTAADVQRVDECLLSNTSHQWSKVARVIGQTMLVLSREFPGMPDVFYSARIKHLADSGAIEAAGNLDRMRHSENSHSRCGTEGISMGLDHYVFYRQQLGTDSQSLLQFS